MSRSRRPVLAALAMVLVAGFAVTGCSSGQDDAAASGTAAGAEAGPANGAALDVAAFAEASQQPGTVILDVRTPDEFATGHLQGAVNIDAEAEDFETQLADLDKDTTYAVYCRSGNRSAAALEQMQDAGFTHVYHLDGGITDWMAAGNPVVT